MPQEPSKDVLSEDKGIHKDEELLIHFFQESLTGVAVTWYTNLESSRVHSWKDLMVAFVRQYQYNSDMASDRMQLQSICKRGHGSFKEYAQRLKDLAAQVVPSMTEKEMITMIVDTLPVLYYEKWWVRTFKLCGFGLR